MINTIDKLNISYNGIFENNKPMTQSEQMYYLLTKLNLIIEHFNLLETNCNKSIEDFNEKVYYYLNNGMVDEVRNKIDQFAKDGVLNDIINEQILQDVKNNIKEIQTGLISFRETYNNDKVATENVIEMIDNELNNNTTQIENNSNEINNIANRVTNTENNIISIKNDYTTVQVVVPNDGIVKKYVMEDNKMAKIRRKYIHCELSATEWKQAWEDLGNGGNHNNGSIWVPFYWAINKNKIIDVNLSLRDLNKWNWNSLGYSKIGVYGLGYVNETGCYVYVENKAPTEQTMGLTFSICITEIYE